MKIRDIIAVLKDRDWKPVRTKGSHQTWLSPDGEERITVVINKKNADAKRALVKQVAQAIGKKTGASGREIVGV